MSRRHSWAAWDRAGLLLALLLALLSWAAAIRQPAATAAAATAAPGAACSTMAPPLSVQLIQRIILAYTLSQEAEEQATLQQLADRFFVSVSTVHRCP